MATASVTYTFTNGTNADAIQVNQNFTDILNFLNASVVQADNSVTIADNAVTTAKIANSAITSVKIQDGAILANDLANGAVIEAKLGTGAVTSTKIATETITNSNISYAAAIDLRKIRFGWTKATRSAAQSIPNATNTTVAFDTTDADITSTLVYRTSNFFYGNITGVYSVSAGINFTANATGIRSLQIVKSNGDVIAEVTQPGFTGRDNVLNCSGIVKLTGDSDYVYVRVYQNSTAALNILADTSTFFSMAWLGS